MDENKQDECGISFKSEMEDNMKRYMQKHENGNLSVDEVSEKMGYHSKLDVIALKNNIF